MCKGVHGLPKDLNELGYRDKYIEYRFSNSEHETVVPDLIVASEQTGHTILFEWKSGCNTDEHQLRRYSKVQERDLREIAFLNNKETVKHDVAIAGKEKCKDRIRIGIERGAYSYPIILISPSRMYLSLNTFCVSELNERLTAGIQIILDESPQYFVPFDRESELWEVAEAILPKVLDLLNKRSRFIPCSDIAKETFPCWDIVSDSYRSDLKKKILRVMKEAADNELSEYFSYKKPDGHILREAAWQILVNPADQTPDRRFIVWKKIQGAHAELIKSLKTGERQGILDFPSND